MPEFTLERIPDPLSDKFSLEDLPRIAPWVYDEVTAVGAEEVRASIAKMGKDPYAPHRMATWVSALCRHHGPLRAALAG